ncbi:hypothetical protein [Tabrizicola sp.]|jgi:hypothetical protein|uniref:hypothetical protein n=1 Tax=Tabrizicola sp. TaxID=2005166 RepID=UPI0035AF452D
MSSLSVLDSISSPKASWQDLQVLSAVIDFPATAPHGEQRLLRAEPRHFSVEQARLDPATVFDQFPTDIAARCTGR